MTQPTDNKVEEVPPNPPTQDLTVKGRFERYNSPFLQLMMPLLTTRYIWLTLEDINPFNFLGKPNPADKPGFVPWKDPNGSKSLSRNFAAIGMGATALAIISYYSGRTYEDIKTLYSEAVGYELDKKPQDVTWRDIFFKSENSALAITRDAFVKRSVARLAAGASFLLPWHKLRDFKFSQPKFDANVNAGVGVMGAYLSLDGFMRAPSFFDMEQNLVSSTINHPETHQGIKANHIESLLMLQRQHLNKNYTWPPPNSGDAHAQTELAARIADLMSQTYNHAPNTEHANFTIGKFNYLIGFGLLDAFPTSHAFVELANKSPDMKDVNKAAAALHSGQDPQTVFAAFGIDINAPTPEKTVVAEVSQPIIAKFTDQIQSNKAKLSPVARTHQELAARSTDPFSPVI